MRSEKNIAIVLVIAEIFIYTISFLWLYFKKIGYFYQLLRKNKFANRLHDKPHTENRLFADHKAGFDAFAASLTAAHVVQSRYGIVGLAVETEDFMLRQTKQQPITPLPELSHEDELQGENAPYQPEAYP